MKKLRFLAWVVLVTTCIVSASNCKKENKETSFPSCDSLNVSFMNTIRPILKNNCDNCHSNANASTKGAGIKLETHDKVFNWIDTAAGSNLGSLFQQVNTGEMPKNQSKISNCDIAKIKHWIMEGAKNN